MKMSLIEIEQCNNQCFECS